MPCYWLSNEHVIIQYIRKGSDVCRLAKNARGQCVTFNAQHLTALVLNSTQQNAQVKGKTMCCCPWHTALTGHQHRWTSADKGASCNEQRDGIATSSAVASCSWLTYLLQSCKAHSRSYTQHHLQQPFMGFVWLLEQTAITSLYNINRLIFKMKTVTNRILHIFYLQHYLHFYIYVLLLNLHIYHLYFIIFIYYKSIWSLCNT